MKRRFYQTMLRFRGVGCDSPPECSIQISELTVLTRIHQQQTLGNPLNVSEIQDNLHLSKPAVSQVLNALQKKGLITREIHPNDRRKIRVSITDQGIQVLQSSTQQYDAVVEQLCQKFGEQQLVSLMLEMDRLTSIYNRLREEWENK